MNKAELNSMANSILEFRQECLSYISESAIVKGFLIGLFPIAYMYMIIYMISHNDILAFHPIINEVDSSSIA
jgi:hypothetical protein